VIKNCVNQNKYGASKLICDKKCCSSGIFIHSNPKIIIEFFQKKDKILFSQISFDIIKKVINQSKALLRNKK
jgi:hypothetical protein